MTTETKTGSLSRLSPSARPFTLSKPSNSSLALNSLPKDTGFSPSSSLLDQSVSSFSLGSDSFGYYPQHPSGVFQVSSDFGLVSESKSDFDSVLVNKSAELGFKAIKSGDHQEIPHGKEKSGGVSISDDDCTKQGCPGKGLKQRTEPSDSLCGKFSGISRMDNELIIKNSKQNDTGYVSSSAVESWPISSKFLTSSDLHSFAILQDPQSGINYPPPAISLGSCGSKYTSFGLNFSQQLDTPASKLNISHPSGSNSLPALVSELSGASTDGHGAVSNNNLFRHHSARVMEPHAIVDKGNEDFHGNVLMDKIKEGKKDKPVTHEFMGPLPMAKSELQITCPSLPIDLNLTSLGVKEGDPIENSFKMLDEKDSDLDSPCWKGKLAASQSTCEVSRPDDFQHLKSGREECSKLNPLAPQFFPSNDKQKVNHCGNECNQDDCLSFQNTASSTVSLFSGEQRLQKPGTTGSSSSKQSISTVTHGQNDIRVSCKEHKPLKHSSGSSMLSSSWMVQPSVLESYFTSNGQLLTEPDAGWSGKVVQDAAYSGPTSVSLFASEHLISSPSCSTGVPSDFTETYGHATKRLCLPPRLDVQMVVRTMNELSELLMQSCRNDLDSLNENEHDIIKQIIINLTSCIRNRVEEHSMMPESSQPSTSNRSRKSEDLNKCSNMELQATRKKDMVLHQFGYQKKHDRQKISLPNFNESFLDSFNARRIEGIEKSEYVTQVSRKAVLEGHNQLEEETNPQVLFYKTLWLEAEAALCSMKYKGCVLGMKSEKESAKMPVR